jgi:protein phosphatase
MSSGQSNTSSSSHCTLRIGTASTAGARDENQDRLAHFQSPFGYVFVLADGMGGHKQGGRAADIATSRFSSSLGCLPESMPPSDALVSAVAELNRAILEESRLSPEQSEGMGSTLAVLLVRDTPDGSLAIGAHVGDSRIYFLRRDRLFCLTRDHSVVQRLVDSGVLTPENAIGHPEANVLTRALGREDPGPVDLTSWMQVQADDVFLLCSDGLSGYVPDHDLQVTLARQESPQFVAEELLRLALAAQSNDNISAVVVRVETLSESSDR